MKIATHSKSPADTKVFAAQIADLIKDGGVLALHGELGAGKTTFVQGLAEALRLADKVLSPTFVLMRQYKLENLDQMLFHIDLYRLDASQSLSQLGLQELFQNPRNIIVIEWPEKISGQLPKNTHHLHFKITDQNSRLIEKD